MASNVVDNAATRALGVVELLEKVLVNLDLKDLERSRRVSHQWNALITTSVNFHQTRFLAPKPITKTARRDYNLALEEDGMTALMSGAVSTDPIWHDRIGKESWGDWDNVRAVATLHPALDQAPGCEILRNGISLVLKIKLELFKTWVAKGGWHDVFPTQPPPKVIHIGYSRIVLEKHVTIGKIVRQVEELKECGAELDVTGEPEDEIRISLSDVLLEDFKILLKDKTHRPGYVIKQGKRTEPRRGAHVEGPIRYRRND